jgi:uncharacterized membrane protein
MTTPAIILAILLIPTALGVLLGKRAGRKNPHYPAGVVALAAAFLFFSIGHFVKTAGMVEMLPPFVPARQTLVLSTGVLEILLAATLLVPRFRRAAGICCLCVLVAFFPANIYAAFNETGLGGHNWGPEYLIVRAPLQLVLLAWTYWFAVRRHDEPDRFGIVGSARLKRRCQQLHAAGPRPLSVPTRRAR